MSGLEGFDLGDPARTWEADRLEDDRIFGNDRSVDDPENAWLNQPERREGRSPILRTLPLLPDGALVLDATTLEAVALGLSLAFDGLGGRARGLLLDGGSMITGGSLIPTLELFRDWLAVKLLSLSSSLFFPNSLLPFLPMIRDMRAGDSLEDVTPPSPLDDLGRSRHSGRKNFDIFGVGGGP